jgi:ATP-dependent 26S proteasome regulatory subunit
MATAERTYDIPELRSQDPNAGYLNAQIRRLRLYLQRRVLWLRRQWSHDPLQDFNGAVISDEQADVLLSTEDRAAEIRFYLEDEAAATLTREIKELEDRLAERNKLLSEAGTPPALELLVQLFGLTPLERDVLILCFAPVLDPRLARLYAYVQDDIAQTQPTANLALTLFCEHDHSAALAAFAPDAPLRRFSLVNITNARVLSIDERIRSFISGVNQPDERIAGWLRPLQPALFLSSHRELVEKISLWLRSRPGDAVTLRLNLVGAPGAGKRAMARAVADRLGVQIVSIDLQHQTISDPYAVARLLEREAVLLQTVFYLNPTPSDRTDVSTNKLVSYMIERARALVIVASSEPLQTERSMLTVRVPKPEAQMRVALWRQALARTGQSFNGELETLAQHFDLGPDDISQAVTFATERSRMRGVQAGAEINVHDLWEACREHAAFNLEELAQRLVPAYEWNDIVLPEDVLRQLEELTAQVAQRHQVYEHWGFGAKLTRGRGISALFSGPSGTGKTMAAEILANHLQLDLYRIDLAGMVSKYIGETEKNLKKVFDVAERTAAILFFDEADALFSKRTDVKDAHDRYANLEVNYLLQRMEDYRGLAILATNRKSDLDRAFLRRLRFLVDFPFPDAVSRRLIWQQVFPPAAELGELDYDWLARLEIAGGSIRNIALNAAFLAANVRAPIDMTHLYHAGRREYAKLDKLIPESEFVR